MEEEFNVGEIAESTEHESGIIKTITWKIPDVSNLPEYVSLQQSSPEFSFANGDWVLQMDITDDSIAAHIYFKIRRLKSLEAEQEVRYRFLIENCYGEKIMDDSSCHTFTIEADTSLSTPFIYLLDLRLKRITMVTDDILTLVCEMRAKHAAAVECISQEEAVRSVKNIEKLLSDLKSLSVTGDQSDVTVMVQGQDFRLHRAILGARTPVFESMFKHNMKEKATGVVTVDDCEVGTFSSFVNYLYTGSVDRLPPENVFRLYDLADKYQVDDLKASCVDVLECGLSIDTFCDICVFALERNEQKLAGRATDFLSKNTLAVMRTKKWQSLLKDKSEQMNEFLMQAIAKEKKNKKPSSG